MPQPALIDQEIAKILSPLLNRRSKVLPLDLARLDSMITKLAKVDKLSATCVRGAWYALQNDKTNAQKMHESAIQQAPKIADLYYNYANSLFFLLDFEGAIKQLIKALALSPNDTGYLDLLLGLGYHCGKEDVLEKYLPTYETLTGHPHSVALQIEEDKEGLKDIPAIMSEAKKEGFISWDKIKADAGL